MERSGFGGAVEGGGEGLAAGEEAEATEGEARVRIGRGGGAELEVEEVDAEGTPCWG